jgi:hypothetical protein
MHTSVHTANVYRELQGFTGKLFREIGKSLYIHAIYRVPSDLQGIPVILVGKIFAVCKQ